MTVVYFTHRRTRDFPMEIRSGRSKIFKMGLNPGVGNPTVGCRGNDPVSDLFN